MQYGSTYMVRPRMQPRKRSVMIAFMSSGSIQLLVAPASFGSRLQMNVRSSTRATSVGSLAHQNEFGFLSSFSRTNVPFSTSRSVTRVHSSGDPSTHSMRSGWVSSAVSRTQASRPACVVGAVSSPGMVLAVMCRSPWRAAG